MNKFKVDYDKKTLELEFEGEQFSWDLNEGDVGDFWHTFTKSDGTMKDINFHQEDENQTPSLAVYGLKKDKESKKDNLSIDMDDETLIEVCETVGNPINYFGAEVLSIFKKVQMTEKEYNMCPNCGSMERTWRNGSGELQCDNCGYEE